MTQTCRSKFTVQHDANPKTVQCELERGHSTRGFNHFATYNNLRIIFWRGKELRKYLPGSEDESGVYQ